MVLTPATHVRAYRREEPMRTTGWSWPAPAHRAGPRPSPTPAERRPAMRTTGWSWPRPAPLPAPTKGEPPCAPPDGHDRTARRPRSLRV